jgi:hypothetical protein
MQPSIPDGPGLETAYEEVDWVNCNRGKVEKKTGDRLGVRRT